jgi:hypothetical protein
VRRLSSNDAASSAITATSPIVTLANAPPARNQASTRAGFGRASTTTTIASRVG